MRGLCFGLLLLTTSALAEQLDLQDTNGQECILSTAENPVPQLAAFSDAGSQVNMQRPNLASTRHVEEPRKPQWLSNASKLYPRLLGAEPIIETNDTHGFYQRLDEELWNRSSLTEKDVIFAIVDALDRDEHPGPQTLGNVSLVKLQTAFDAGLITQHLFDVFSGVTHFDTEIVGRQDLWSSRNVDDVTFKNSDEHVPANKPPHGMSSPMVPDQSPTHENAPNSLKLKMVTRQMYNYSWYLCWFSLMGFVLFRSINCFIIIFDKSKQPV